MIEQRSHIADRIAPMGDMNALLATPKGRTRGTAFSGLISCETAVLTTAGIVDPTPSRRPPLE
jgi:hypothetical protein